MEWRVTILNGKDAPQFMKDFSADRASESMGDANFVRQAISATLPDVDWLLRSSGRFCGEGFRLYFVVPEKNSIELMICQVRGDGDSIPAIFHLCEQNNWAAYFNGNRLMTIEQARRDWNLLDRALRNLGYRG